MPVRRRPRRRLLATAAVVVAVAVAAGAANAGAAVPGPSRVVVASLHDGVRTIGDLRVGPLGGAGVASTLIEVRAEWGREHTLTPRSCIAGWGTGVRLLFTTFGGPAPCGERFLQQATVKGPRWVVRIGRQRYRIGLPRRSLPPDARRILGAGVVLATMPFIGSRTPSVVAHVNGRTNRVDRYALFIGGAGD
jgi:hypothetical protein